MNIINNYVNIYYIMILAYSLYFIALSLRSELPWEKCDPKWASESKTKKKKFLHFNLINKNFKTVLMILHPEFLNSISVN
jgi:hypothetical protein